MATEDDNVSSGALGTLLTVGAFTTLGIMLVVTALVRSEMSEEAEKKEVGANQPYLDLVNEQSAKLSAPAALVDRGKGLVSLPIERAMELTVSGLKKDPNSATPPAPPAAAGSGGTGGSAAEAATGGSGGTGGSAEGAAPTEGATPKDEAKPTEETKPAEGEKKDGEKKDGEKKEKEKEKKDAPKPKPAPAAPAPVPAAPAPAPVPAAPAPAP